MSVELDLLGAKYTERQLLEGVMRNLKRMSRAHPQRWIAVMNAFAVGSTVAHAICREFGYDPEEKLK